MAAGIQWIVHDEDVLMLLVRLEAAISPPSLMMFLGSKVGPYLHMRETARFAKEGDDVTGPWAPLKESTLRWRHWSGHDWPEYPINVRTGQLKDFIMNAPNAITPYFSGAKLSSPGDLPTDKVTLKKLKTAQLGQLKKLPYQGKTVPRPVMGVNESDHVFVRTQLMEHIMGSAM